MIRSFTTYIQVILGFCFDLILVGAQSLENNCVCTYRKKRGEEWDKRKSKWRSGIQFGERLKAINHAQFQRT